MLNETLARYSELFMYIAALIYTVVFVAFTWDVVKNSRVTRRLEGAAAPREAELEEEQAAEPVTAGAASSVAGAEKTGRKTAAKSSVKMSAKATRVERTGGAETGTGERGAGYRGAAARALEATWRTHQCCTRARAARRRASP